LQAGILISTRLMRIPFLILYQLFMNCHTNIISAVHCRYWNDLGIFVQLDWKYKIGKITLITLYIHGFTTPSALMKRARCDTVSLMVNQSLENLREMSKERLSCSSPTTSSHSWSPNKCFDPKR
jgi:hypothetical protein